VEDLRDDSHSLTELTRRFREFASTTSNRAPLYRALAATIADDADLVRLLQHAPLEQQLPVLLLASTHFLVLDQPHSELAQWYPNLTPAPRSPDDPSLRATFGAFVADHEEALLDLLATQTTQTNEVGRCASFLPALALLADEAGPLGHLDVGTSGGLNLLLDQYEYRYAEKPVGGAERSAHVVGGPSDVVLDTTTRGDVPVPSRIPEFTARIGIDRDPIDVTDPSAARWLEACVWPDQADRFHRLRAAIAIAETTPPEIRRSDAIQGLAAGIEDAGATGHPVVTNSWVLNYLSGQERTAYLAELDRIGLERDISWVFAESPELVPELPITVDGLDTGVTALTVARWRNGVRSVATVATCHPHGYWINWL
jgi:hypothetical protein